MSKSSTVGCTLCSFPHFGRVCNLIGGLFVAGRVVFFISEAGYEPAFQAGSLGVTAAAMGDEVYFIFGFNALRQLARGAFGEPLNERESAELTRAEGLGVATPVRMLTQARSMGARLLACDTTVKVCGLTASQLTGPILDEVTGLASLWRLTQGARTLTF
jgi:peroxiredoxin family protein